MSIGSSNFNPAFGPVRDASTLTLKAKVGADHQLKFEADSLEDFRQTGVDRMQAQFFMEKAADTLSPPATARPSDHWRDSALEGSSVSSDGSNVTVEKGESQRGTWNQADGTFTYEKDQPAIPWAFVDDAPFYLMNGAEGTPVQQEAFHRASNGTLTCFEQADQASSAKPEAGTAQRAEDLIRAALLWQEEGRALDGKDADLHGGQAAVVAPELSSASLSEAARGETVLTNGSNGPVDLEVKGDDFLFGGSAGNLFGANTADELQVTFRPASGELTGAYLPTEKVTLNKADGSVLYQKFGVAEEVYEPEHS